MAENQSSPPPFDQFESLCTAKPVKKKSRTLWITLSCIAIAMVMGFAILATIPASEPAVTDNSKRESATALPPPIEIGRRSEPRRNPERVQPITAPEPLAPERQQITHDEAVPTPAELAPPKRIRQAAADEPIEDPVDLPPALKPVVPSDPGGKTIVPKGVPLVDEIIETLIDQLRTSPSVTNRRNAAISLGRRGDEPDLVVPHLLDAARKDPSPEVRGGCVEAFGLLSSLGENEATVLAFLRDQTFKADNIEDKRAAGEALIKAAPNSAEAKQVLRTALVGGKGTSPFATAEMEHGAENTIDWRHWAYEQLASPDVKADWAIPYLIKICEVEMDASGRGFSYGVQEHLEITSTAMAELGGKTPAVQAHLKKYINSVFPEMEHATQLRVHYDSLLKKIETAKANK